MISLNKNKIFILGWIGLIIFAILIAKQIPKSSEVIDYFLDQVSSRTGGETNLIIAYIILVTIPFAPFILIRLNPINLIAVTIALLPLFARIETIFGIYAYNDFNGNPIYISGIALFAPIIFIYLSLRYPTGKNILVWMLPSSKAFWLFIISGVLTQFIFFDFFSAIRISYLIIIVQLFIYLIIVGYVNTFEDVYKITWGILIAVMISIFLAVFTSSQEIKLISPEYSIRLESNSLGPNNFFAGLLASLLCLIPVIFLKTRRYGKIILLVFFFFIFKALILTGTRGAYIAVLPITSYVFLIRRRSKNIIYILIFFVISLSVFYSQIHLYLDPRPIYLDSRLFLLKSVADRLLLSKYVLQELMNWPFFITGFGMLTIDNLVPSPIFYGMPLQGVHQGFLNIWVSTGFFGLIGFMLWLGYAILKGIKKIYSFDVKEDKLVIFGLIICLSSWIISFITTGGWYISKYAELYAILTTEVGMLVVLGQKLQLKKS